MAGRVSGANSADFRVRVGDSGAFPDFRVIEIDGVEALSELFRYRIDLVSADLQRSADEILGKPAVIQIDGERGTREVHGIVRRFRRTGQSRDLAHYRADIVPPHWILTRRVQSRVFNENRCSRTDVVGIVAKVLADAGLSDKSLSTAGLRSYDSREFVVQYGESDWAFVCRLLEEEGIYFYFERGDDGCRMVLKDAAGSHVSFDGREGVIPFRDARNLVPDKEHVFHAERRGRIRRGAAALDDFDFRNPGRELRVKQTGGAFTGLTEVHYPGRYADTERGKRLLQTRFEAEQCDRSTFKFKSSVRDLWPGGRFRLADHPDESFDLEYLITRVRITATQPQSGESDESGGGESRFQAVVRAIPADVQFRAPLETPWPRVRGSQTALVVGPPGEEIHVDEYGRVEVRFHWDQEWGHDVGASCWIRVSQGWAGGQYGMVFLPRVGQEVIVDFLEGDPDQPIITGRVYNKDHLPPYKLPDHRTVSAIRTCTSPGAGGGNEIRFEDKKGGEQLLLFAQNSLHMRSRGSRFESVGGDAHSTVAGDAYELSKKNRHSIVTLDSVDEVHGNADLRVEGDRRESIQGNQCTYVQKKHNLLNSDGLLLASDTSVSLQCGGNMIRVDRNGITILGRVVNVNSGGSAEAINFLGPEIAEEPKGALSTRFGHNTRYSAVAAPSPRQDTPQERDLSWIDIELVDDLGQPVPGEAYEVILPDGTKITGTLDGSGRAHVAVPDPGQCQITFPRLDASAWEPVA